MIDFNAQQHTINTFENTRWGGGLKNIYRFEKAKIPLQSRNVQHKDLHSNVLALISYSTQHCDGICSTVRAEEDLNDVSP